MNILLDECVDVRFVHDLVDFHATTVKHAGLSSLSNGELLKQIESQYDILITVDKNLPKQQNLEKYDLTIMVLNVRWNKLQSLQELLPALKQKLWEWTEGDSLFSLGEKYLCDG